jgi:hypothetical protein
LKTRIFGRLVIWRARRIEKRLASVAESANCQYARPKRFCNSSATKTASSDGSISVMPRFTCSSMAFAVANGECPVMAPVSPRQRSM